MRLLAIVCIVIALGIKAIGLFLSAYFTNEVARDIQKNKEEIAERVAMLPHMNRISHE